MTPPLRGFLVAAACCCCQVFVDTGTIWENLAPELLVGGPGRQAAAVPGDISKGDFVGWGGIGPVAVFFEVRSCVRGFATP